VNDQSTELAQTCEVTAHLGASSGSRHAGAFVQAAVLEACPVCDGRDVRPYLRARDAHNQIPGEFSTSRCGSCGLVFMNPMPSVAELAALYPSGYYSYVTPDKAVGFRRALAAARNLAIKLLGFERRTLVPKFVRPGVMLDVGCGAGLYLLQMRKRGWRVHGSELSAAAAEEGRRQGLDIRGGELTEAGFEAETFDFVRLNHSFEHMPDPVPVLREIRRILKADGKLFVGVPNLASAAAKVFGRYWWNFGVPLHTYNYSAHNLSLLLERHGFTVVRLRYYSHYTAILGSLQILANRKRRPGIDTGPILNSWMLRLLTQPLARTLDLFHLGDCIELICTQSRAPQAARERQDRARARAQ
jgi:SAM-dependent methyltransferase